MAKICQMCVMDYVNRIIETENSGLDIGEFDTNELLFIIGEKTNEENIANMNQAKEQFYTVKNIRHMKLAKEGMYK